MRHITLIVAIVAIVSVIAVSWQPSPALAVRTTGGMLTTRLSQPYQIGQELVDMRDRTTKIYYEGVGSYSADYSIESVHYEDEYGDWQEIDTTIVNSTRPNWDWEVEKGHWTLLIAANTTVAIGKAGHWIGFRYAGYGYLDWGSKDYIVLGTANNVTPVVTDNSITWPNLFGGVDLEYVYTADGFKENLYISQSARDWLVSNPPSSYGLNNSRSYLVGGLECDWQGSYPAETIDGTPIDWDSVNEFITSGVYFRHPVLDEIITALPLGYARHDAVDAANWTQLRYRFYRSVDTNYLLFGAKVLDLNSYPSGTINLDPSVDLQVGTGYDDSGERESTGDQQLTATDIYVWRDTDVSDRWWMAARWVSGSFPSQGATITTAYTSVQCASTTRNDMACLLYFEKASAPAQYSATAYDVSGRTYTTSNAAWTQANLVRNVFTNSPSIVDEAQEVIDAYSPTVMAVLFKTVSGSGQYCDIYGYEVDSSRAAKLYLEWSTCSPSISNSPSSWSVNNGTPVATSSNYTSGLGNFNVTNNSGGAVDITIGGQNMTGGGYTWELSNTATAGDMTYGLKAGLSGGSYNVTVKLTAPYNTLVANLADSTSQLWGLQLFTPTSYDDANTKSGNVTLTAACA